MGRASNQRITSELGELDPSNTRLSMRGCHWYARSLILHAQHPSHDERANIYLPLSIAGRRASNRAPSRKLPTTLGSKQTQITHVAPSLADGEGLYEDLHSVSHALTKRCGGKEEGQFNSFTFFFLTIYSQSSMETGTCIRIAPSRHRQASYPRQPWQLAPRSGPVSGHKTEPK